MLMIHATKSFDLNLISRATKTSHLARHDVTHHLKMRSTKYSIMHEM